MIDDALNAISQVGDHIHIKYSRTKKLEERSNQY